MADLPSATDRSVSSVHNDPQTSHPVEHSVPPSVSPLRVKSPESPIASSAKFICPSASPDQQLLLDGLNNDVLAIIIDLVFGIDHPETEWLYYDKPYFRRHPSTLSLSLVNRRLRSVCMPKLFRNVFRLSATMGQLNRQLKDIERDNTLLSCIRTCEIVTSSRDTSVLCKTRIPKVLAMMTQLTELSITHRKNVDFSALDKTFRKSNVSLTSIVGLRIQCAGDWDFLVKACPNTENLILRDSLHCVQLMEAVGDLKRLRHLELFSDAWTEDDISYLGELVPGIQSLALKGEIFNEALSDFGEALGYFHKLRTLAIATTQWTPESVIESAMSDDSTVARSMMRRWRSYREGPFDEEQEVVASVYFGCCPALERLYLVEWDYPIPWGVTRTSDGSVESIDCLESDDDHMTFPISYESIQDGRKGMDSDGFPLVLSFPREILTYRTDQDPPNYGRESKEERDAREKEKSWYMERWQLYHSDT